MRYVQYITDGSHTIPFCYDQVVSQDSIYLCSGSIHLVFAQTHIPVPPFFFLVFLFIVHNIMHLLSIPEPRSEQNIGWKNMLGGFSKRISQFEYISLRKY